VSAARNEALRHARGEFIALLDGDDTYFPEKLELQVRVMEENPEAALAFVDLALISASGEPLGSAFSPHRVFRDWISARRRGRVAAGWIYREMLIQMCTPGSTAMLRRKCLDAVGYYDPSLGAGAEDYELYLRLAQRFPVVCLERVLYRYRWHEASSSGPFATRIERWMTLHRQVRKAHFRNLPEDLPGESWAALSQYYWDAMALDRLEEARLLFRPCLRHQRRKAKATLFYLGSYLPSRVLRLVRSLRGAVRRVRPAAVRQGASP
jgi:glycosyltransferase involved in cell wall biosynthesis